MFLAFGLLDCCRKVLFMRGILPLQGAFRQVILTQRYSEKRIPNLWAKMWALPLDMHQAMRDKYLKGVFGTCPRVLCDSTGLRWLLKLLHFLKLWWNCCTATASHSRTPFPSASPHQFRSKHHLMLERLMLFEFLLIMECLCDVYDVYVMFMLV